MRVSTAYLVVLGFASVCSPVAGGVINFEGVIVPPATRSAQPIFSYSEGGFLFDDVSTSGSNLLFGPGDSLYWEGTDALAWGDNSTFEITEQAGGLFSISSLDGTNAGTLPVLGFFHIAGFLPDGTTVENVFQYTYGTFSTYTLEPVLGVGWDRLTRVEITAVLNAGAIDNIVLTPAPIPEPTTLALFGLGLAGLVAWRRKMRKAV